MATKKSVKKANNKFDFSDSVNSIKNTAKKNEPSGSGHS